MLVAVAVVHTKLLLVQVAQAVVVMEQFLHQAMLALMDVVAVAVPLVIQDMLVVMAVMVLSLLDMTQRYYKEII
jgi:hypothetical protein